MLLCIFKHFLIFNLSFFQRGNLVFLGGQQIISSEIEDQLAQMIDKVAEWGFPVGKFELKLMVKDMLTKKGNQIKKITKRNLGKPKFNLLKKKRFSASRHLLTQSQQ